MSQETEPLKIDMEFLKKRPLSYSSLKAFKRSPKHYIHYITAKKKETPALIFGNLVDTLLFSKEKFAERFEVAGVVNRKTKAGKRQWKEFLEKAGRKAIILQSDLDEANKICEMLHKHPKASSLLNTTVSTQKKITYTDKETGLPVIMYIDGVGEEVKFVWDLKTAADASRGEFPRACYKYCYHLQTGVYKVGLKSIGKFPDFYFVAVEKADPYAIAVYKATEDFVNEGVQLFDYLLKSFKMCMDTNAFDQGYEFHTAVGYSQLDLPYYAKSK